MPEFRVLHLVDDTTAGGVMRVVDFLIATGNQQPGLRHERLGVGRGDISVKRHAADIIVSHLTINWRSIPALMALRTANLGKRMIHVEHSYTKNFVVHNVRARRRFASLLRVGFALFDRIVAVSFAQADWLTSCGLCPAAKLTTIQSCVDLAPFRAIKPANRPVRTLGAIGRLDRQKGFDKLINAFKQCPNPDLALHIYGEGEEEHALRQRAAGDSRIVFKGFASEPAMAYDNVDVVVMPSRWEAYGLVAVEALSAGRPVLCANVDGLRDHTKVGARVFDSYAPCGLVDELSRIGSASLTKGTSECRKGPHLEAVFTMKWSALLEQELPRATLSQMLPRKA